jgi:hypothetical protein
MTTLAAAIIALAIVIATGVTVVLLAAVRMAAIIHDRYHPPRHSTDNNPLSNQEEP